MSPMLFNVYVEQSIQKIKEKFNRQKVGVTVGEELIQTFRFAEDIASITKSEKEMKMALEEMQESFEEFDLKINWRKTKVIMICYKAQQKHRLPTQVENNHKE